MFTSVRVFTSVSIAWRTGADDLLKKSRLVQHLITVPFSLVPDAALCKQSCVRLCRWANAGWHGLDEASLHSRGQEAGSGGRHRSGGPERSGASIEGL